MTNVRSELQAPANPTPEFPPDLDPIAGRVLGDFSCIIAATQQFQHGRNAMKRNIVIPSAVGTAALIASALITAPALSTPGSGFAPSPIVNGHFGTLNENTADKKTGQWGMILKTLDDTDIGADRLSLQPGAYSGWHAHPANVFVTVTQGSVIWYDGSDPLCPSRTYSAGESFIEGAYRIHDVRNASSSATAEYVAIVIKPAGFVGPAFRLDRPEPNNCNF